MNTITTTYDVRKRSDEDMVRDALKRVEDIPTNTGKGAAIGVSEGTIRRWLAGEIATPLRKDTRTPLRRFLASSDDDGEMGVRERTTPYAADQRRVAAADRIRLAIEQLQAALAEIEGTTSTGEGGPPGGEFQTRRQEGKAGEGETGAA